jgi:hypothetical protein
MQTPCQFIYNGNAYEVEYSVLVANFYKTILGKDINEDDENFYMGEYTTTLKQYF